MQDLLPERFQKIVNKSDKNDYEIYEIEARKLFCPERFDFYAKYLFVDHYAKGLDLSYAEDVYKRHIQAITGFTFSEKDHADKNSYEDFVAVFKKLIIHFKDGEFDKTKSLITLSKDGIPMDGAHRIVSSAYFNKKVWVIRMNKLETGPVPNFDFFKNNLLLEKYLDAMALEYCNIHKNNLFISCLWPVAHDTKLRQKADELIRQKVNVVCKKELKLSYNGLKNLMIQIYFKFDWLGTDFRGIFQKLEPCYKKNQSTIFYLFESNSLDFVVEMKKEIRDIFKIDTNSIHITDYYRETKQIANLIFNQNSVNHLNKSNPTKFKKSYSLMEDYKSIILNQNLSLDDFVVDTSLSMAIYGIRDAEDLDYYTTSKMPYLIEEKAKIKGSINNHQDEIRHHLLGVDDMINIPSNHFFYNELKFLSLENIKIMKKRRNEKKDRTDIKLINSFLDENKFKYVTLGIKNSYLRKKRKLLINIKNPTITFLKYIGLFNPIYKIYKNLKKILK